MDVRSQFLRQRGPTLLLFFVLSLAVVLACQSRPARFAHGPHLGLACGEDGQPECLSCTSCHSDVASEGGPAHPLGKNCKDCHEKDHRKALASLQVPRTAAAEAAGQITFNHELHLSMEGTGGQCITCHSGLVSEEGGTPYPSMGKCFECHEHQQQWDDGVCAPCHQLADLKNLFPRSYLRHGEGWDRKHGVAAALTTKQCAQCHTKESCDDCHDVTQGLSIETRAAAEVQRDFIHPADFVTRHAMEAASQPARCLSCHRTETCDSCHLERGVSAGRIGSTNPHPPGFTGPDSSDPRHHGRAARRDILACASCHDQGPNTNCIDCHRVGGSGGNPHPSGWKSRRTPSDAMCIYCHEEGP